MVILSAGSGVSRVVNRVIAVSTLVPILFRFGARQKTLILNKGPRPRSSGHSSRGQTKPRSLPDSRVKVFQLVAFQHPSRPDDIMNKRNHIRLPPEVNRLLYVRNLPYKITSDEMYDIFGKFGAIRQIRVGNTPETRGTAFVVYEDIFDAKNACDHLSGFNVCNRYLVVLYYQSNKAFKRVDMDKKQEELNNIKAKYNLKTPEAP